VKYDFSKVTPIELEYDFSSVTPMKSTTATEAFVKGATAPTIAAASQG